jgi:hypothetical protein
VKITGLLLMPSGWFIVLAALVLLPSVVARNTFIMAGMAVELLGLILFTRAHAMAKRGSE